MTRRVVAWICAATMLVPPWGLPPREAQAQPAGAAAAQAAAFSPEQLDALLAPIALYPDALLTQVLMASAWPLQVVEAARWLSNPANAALQGDALARALQSQSWDPAVKSLVPFPTVLTMMNGQLDWMQQLGYAFSTQQGDVLDSVQRLRQQAQGTGCLRTTEQQVVSAQGQTIVIAPANPDVVYVPAYNPTVVYGSWPYPSYPPVYFPPPPGYAVGNALLTGLAFGVGVGVVASLWNIGSPNWGYRNVNVNVNRWNSINVNRPPIRNPGWRPPPPRRRRLAAAGWAGRGAAARRRVPAECHRPTGGVGARQSGAAPAGGASGRPRGCRRAASGRSWRCCRAASGWSRRCRRAASGRSWRRCRTASWWSWRRCRAASGRSWWRRAASGRWRDAPVRASLTAAGIQHPAGQPRRTVRPARPAEPPAIRAARAAAPGPTTGGTAAPGTARRRWRRWAAASVRETRIMARWVGRMLGLLLAVAALAGPAAAADYATPEDAVAALEAALKADDPAALSAVFGPDSNALLGSGDKVADRNARQRFLEELRDRAPAAGRRR